MAAYDRHPSSSGTESSGDTVTTNLSSDSKLCSKTPRETERIAIEDDLLFDNRGNNENQTQKLTRNHYPRCVSPVSDKTPVPNNKDKLLDTSKCVQTIRRPRYTNETNATDVVASGKETCRCDNTLNNPEGRENLFCRFKTTHLNSSDKTLDNKVDRSTQSPPEVVTTVINETDPNFQLPFNPMTERSTLLSLNKIDETEFVGYDDIKKRDININKFQLQHLVTKTFEEPLNKELREITKLKKRYSKLLMIFTVLNVVVIICVVSVVSAILISSKMWDFPESRIKENVARQLESSETKEKLTATIFCVKCEHISSKIDKYFMKNSKTGECCVENMITVLTQITDYHDKRFEKIDMTVKDISLFTSLQNSSARPYNLTKIHGIHAELAKNKEMLGELLTRSRSAIHLKSTAIHDFQPVWETEMHNTITLHNNVNVTLTNAGAYFIYCTIRFKVGECENGKTIGYQIKVHGHHKIIASINHECHNGTNIYEQDLSIQRVHRFVGDSNTLFIRIQKSSEKLLHEHGVHSFGMFEI